MMKASMVLCLLATPWLLSACATTSSTNPEPLGAVFTATYSESPVQIDGVLDDPVWERTPAYPLHLAADEDPEGLDPVQEAGETRLAWDEDFLYVAMRFEDSDVVAEGQNDNDMHFTMGDVGEVFIKPASNTLYWELYVTPHGKKSAFFFPSWSRSLPSSFEYTMELHVGARVQGTLNNWRDTDQGWTGEMAIPRKELERHGDAFPGDGWTILIARYNYGRYLAKQGPELTMAPRLPITSYHYHPGYATLELRRDTKK